MLRVQAHHEDEDLESGEVELHDSLKPQDGGQSDEQFLWMLLLAAVAECVTTCFVPGYSLPQWGVNVGGTALNWLGPFLDGVSYGYEEGRRGGGVSLAVVQFRSAFLGVFTSYSFMVDHAGDLSGSSFAAGPIYVCASVVGGCLCFQLGKQTAMPALRTFVAVKVKRTLTGIRTKPSLGVCLLAFVGLTLVIAALGPHGFVRDPNDPQFIGPLQVADGEELVLGILMSCSAILLSNYVCEFFPKEPSKLHSAASRTGGPFIDWGCLSCNFLACLFAGLTYQLSRVSPAGLTNNLLALKFVSSFCGSLSMFSGCVSIISRLWLAGNRSSALWNLSLHLLVGLLFIPYLYKHDAD